MGMKKKLYELKLNKMDILEIFKKLVKENPNDSDLGKKVREMYHKLKSDNNGVQQEDTQKR
jgi:hypothetical protein